MPLGRVDDRAVSRDRSAELRRFRRRSGVPQDIALNGTAAEEKSAPETLTTACHAASWLARSWRCGWSCASIGPVNFPSFEAKNCPETSVPNSDAWRYRRAAVSGV